MPDVLGYRAKFGVLVPSTNTIVEPDFYAMAPPGVTLHTGRISITNPRMEDDAGMEALMVQIRASIGQAVRDVMTWGVVTVSPETDIRQAAGLMREQKIGALPVVQGERVMGILTETDVLRAFQDVLGKGVLSKPYKWAFAYR